MVLENDYNIHIFHYRNDMEWRGYILIGFLTEIFSHKAHNIAKCAIILDLMM